MRSESETRPVALRTVDGVGAAETAEPASPQEAADVLADAAARDLVVAPVGGGTALALGNPPERLDLVLSTARLGGVIDYEPSDLVLSIGAGARLGDAQAVLAEHGQTLPIDPPGGDDATIGGLIATALVGPRRLGSGSLRDLLIGIAVAHPSGTVTKAGGMVVKNVTGFDLPRIYHGSLGTLGVVVSANFKVLPLPRAEATAVSAASTAAGAVAAAERVLASRQQPAALEATYLDGHWRVVARLVGRESSLRASTDETRMLLGGAEVLDGPESAAWWKRDGARRGLAVAPDEALLRCSVRPRQTAVLVHGVLAAVDELGLAIVHLDASIGLGTVLVRLRFAAARRSSEGLLAVRDRLLGLADHVVVLAAPPTWKQGLDVWGPAPETLDLMRALKEQFDPGRVLNRGRYVGRI